MKQSVNQKSGKKQPAPKPRTRRDASAVAKSLDLDDQKKRAILIDMAERYEAKKFMPNVTHVRAFLESQGMDVSRVKSRQQVTRSVFKNLAELEIDILRDIQDSGLYGPPKTLASIAAAIGGFKRQRYP